MESEKKVIGHAGWRRDQRAEQRGFVNAMLPAGNKAVYSSSIAETLKDIHAERNAIRNQCVDVGVSANEIQILQLYRVGPTWVFDDDRFGLRAEPFVGGMSEIIDRCLPTTLSPRCTLIFSANEFPAYQYRLGWLWQEFGGNTYELAGMGMQGWLCPALLHYFKEAPPSIYVQLKSDL